MKVPDVEIYSSAWCGFCHRAKHLLSEKGVNFTDIPGENNHNHFMGAPEEIFSSGRVSERKVNGYKIVID